MKISEPTLKLLQKQVSIENSNHLIYLELADWCSLNSYDNATKLFKSQAKGEITHRNKFREFLLDMDQAVSPFTLEKVEYKPIKTLEDTILAALNVEQHTTAEIKAIRKSAEENEDYEVCVMIQWFITEQIEEEALFNTLVKRIRNSKLLDAPDWYKGTIRQELDDYIEDLLDD